MSRVTVLGTAMAVTFFLFFLMQALVASGPMELEAPTIRPFPDVIFNEPEIEVRGLDRIIQPPEPVVIPEQIDLPTTPTDTGSEIPRIGIPGPTTVEPTTTFDPGLMEGERVPLVAVQPQYPTRQLENGVQGWVMIRFDVDPSGMVQNAEIADAEPKGAFDRAALKAIAKFRYKPSVVNGQAVWSRNNFYRMKFTISD